MKVTVLGAGNGAYALAFHLVQLKHEVLMHVPEQFKNDIQSVEDNGCIEAPQHYEAGTSELHGVSSISKVTTDIKEALEFSHVIMLVVPSFGQGSSFAAALPYLHENHVFISLPGNFAFVEYINIIKENSSLDVNKDLPFTLVETSSIPYACRKVGGNKVFIDGEKKVLEVGVYPSSKTQATIQLIKPLFSLKLHVMKNVLETGFYNLNFVFHPPIIIYNAGWIEATRGDFLFYTEGATRGILNIVEALDKERCEIANKAGFNVENAFTALKNWYGDESINLLDFMENSNSHETIKAPANLGNRYITEDLSFVLIPIIEYFTKKYNIQTPVADAIITSAKHLTGLPIKSERELDNFPRDFAEL